MPYGHYRIIVVTIGYINRLVFDDFTGYKPFALIDDSGVVRFNDKENKNDTFKEWINNNTDLNESIIYNVGDLSLNGVDQLLEELHDIEHCASFDSELSMECIIEEDVLEKGDLVPVLYIGIGTD